MDKKDQSVWEALIKTCKPLSDKKDKGAIKAMHKPVAKPSKPKADINNIPSPPSLTPTPIKPHSLEMEHRIFKKLKKGKIFIEGKIDLHGMNQERAFNSLNTFVRNMSAQGKKYGLVITGKSGEVLKPSFPKWLELPEIKPFVISYKQADKKHGGEGAFYLVVRKGGK